jgi:general secretion pathway protein B
MSFILDALKKAEAERQRQTGPTLLEVRVAQPRRRFPAWTVVIGVLLVVNVAVLLAFLLRRPAPPPMPATGSPAGAAPPSAGLPAAGANAPLAAAPIPAGAASVVPPNAAPAPAPASAAANGKDSGSLTSENPADFEPALPGAGPQGVAPGGTGGQRRAEPPSLSEIGGDLPDLRLDLHVYSTRPADRYALINMHRVHEGDVLPEGPRVIAIDRDGVELSYRGTEFMLHPQ